MAVIARRSRIPALLIAVLVAVGVTGSRAHALHTRPPLASEVAPSAEPGPAAEVLGACHLMPGLPPWLFFGVALLILVVSFVLVAAQRRAGPAPGHRWRFDLLGSRAVRALVKHRAFPLAVQLPVTAGLFGSPSPERNIAPILTWTIWWASLVLVVLFLGKIWCTACPWMALADWLGRFLPRLERAWPRRLRSIWPATAFFVVLCWLELGYDVTAKPWLTATLGLVMFLFAVVTVVVFERKAFCRYACLVGRVSGLYATFASSELRARDAHICRRCATKDCYHGNTRGAPCPTRQFLGVMAENTYCTLCMACAKTCPADNVAWNVRPWGADLLESIRPRADEAHLAVIMVAMTAFHGFTMTLAWQRVVHGIAATTGLGGLAAFSIGMAVMLIVPIAVYYGVCVLMSALAGERGPDARTLFIRFAYSLIPIALFYHLAHNLQHVLFEGSKLVRVSSDPFGWGWNLFGTATIPVGAVLPAEAVWALQVTLVLVGHIYAIVIAHRTARALYGDARLAIATEVPLLTAMLLFSFQSLWLLSQPMLMRTAL
jgi:hypothetical protein